MKIIQYSVFMILFSSCYAGTETPTVSPEVEKKCVIVDAGQQPVLHRLKVGFYTTSDGLRIADGYLYDTAFNTTCFPSSDDTDRIRCFPNVGYSQRSYSSISCLNPVLVSVPGAQLAGSFENSKLRLNKTSTQLPDTTEFFKIQNGICTKNYITPGQALFTAGEDITNTLETLDEIFE